MHEQSSINQAAIGATLHCLAGCSIGEILGLIIGTVAAMDNLHTAIISTALAFVFGFSLSMLPLIRRGVSLKAAASVVLAADTLSITAMEITDNSVMLLIPGAMDATLINPLFWISMTVSLFVAFWAAFPVNRYLLNRGKGHALIHNIGGHA